MSLMMVVFWGAVILAIVWLIRGVAGGGSASGEAAARRESALEILERRFAEGALTPEDYRARREILVRGPGDAPTDEPLTAR